MLLKDMPALTFGQAMDAYIGSVSFDWVVEVGQQPVALFLGNSIAAGRGAEIQVDWMPWATPRNRLEATAAFIKFASQQHKLFLYADVGDDRLFALLASRYRMLRKGCKIINYHGGGRDAMFYYSPGPF